MWVKSIAKNQFHLKPFLICSTQLAAELMASEHLLSTFPPTCLLKGQVFLRSVLLSLLRESTRHGYLALPLCYVKCLCSLAYLSAFKRYTVAAASQVPKNSYVALLWHCSTVTSWKPCSGLSYTSVNPSVVNGSYMYIAENSMWCW